MIPPLPQSSPWASYREGRPLEGGVSLSVSVDTAGELGPGLVCPAARGYWLCPPAHIWLRHKEGSFPTQLLGEAAGVWHRLPSYRQLVLLGVVPLP